MRALRKTAPRPGAELEDVPVPDPGEGEVLVRVHAASICGPGTISVPSPNKDQNGVLPSVYS